MTAEAEVKARRLVRVLPDWHIPPVPMAATFLERRHMPQRIRAFLDLIVQQIQPRSKPEPLGRSTFDKSPFRSPHLLICAGAR